MKYIALAFYKFLPLENPLDFLRNHKNFLKNQEITGRIYISEEGINAQMSGTVEAFEAYKQWLIEKDGRFEGQYFNIQPCNEHVFPKMIVKYRKQIVAIDTPIDITQTGTHVPPAQWSEMLEKEENKVVIDVRNDYEWEIGHFAGATLPALSQFRDFPSYAEELKQKIDPEKTKVMMYCTGGIRCELYSALLKQRGFKEVYQLQGGVIRYGNEEGKKHWRGKLYVFDDRMAVPIDEQESEILTTCSHCSEPSDTYYNCANMDCNNLFRACKNCLASTKGCCSETCQGSSRLRAFERDGNKPFRKKHLSKMACETCCSIKHV